MTLLSERKLALSLLELAAKEYSFIISVTESSKEGMKLFSSIDRFTLVKVVFDKFSSYLHVINTCSYETIWADIFYCPFIKLQWCLNLMVVWTFETWLCC